MRRFQGALLALHLARRFALQSVGRSVLVAVLIAIPILGMSLVDTVVASGQPTRAETARIELGQAQGLLHVVSPPDPGLEQDPFDAFSYGTGSTGASTGTPRYRSPADVLPAGTRLIPSVASDAVFSTPTGSASLPANEGAVWDPSLRGAFQLLSGRAPRSPSEVLATPATLTRLGIALGGTVTELQPARRSFTVVGTLLDAHSTNADEQLYGGTGAFDTLSTRPDATALSYYVPDLRLPWSEVKTLNQQGITALSRDVLLHPETAAGASLAGSSGSSNVLLILLVTLVGAFGLLEVCLLAGAAFAVGARHRQRGLAVLSSVGATRRMIFAVMSLEGVVIGLVAGVVGALAGAGLAGIARPILAQGSVAQYPGFHVQPLLLAAIVAGSVVSGWIAAAVPARAASRVDVVAALRGARRPPRPSLRRPMAGVFVVSGGSILALLGGLVTVAANQSPSPSRAVTTGGIVLLIAGPVVMQIGMVLIAPLLLRVVSGALSAWGPGARLGSRDASRNPGRTVPALAAIMSCVFLCSFVLCAIGGGQTLNDRNYPWSAPLHTVTVSLYDSSSSVAATLVPGKPVAQAVDRDLRGASARILQGTPDFGVFGDTVPTYTVPRLQQSADLSSPFLGQSGGQDHVTVGSLADLRVILGAPVSPTSAATLRAGGAVALAPEYVKDGRVTFDTVTSTAGVGGTPGRPIRTTGVPATVQAPAHPEYYGVFVLPGTASALGMRVVPSAVVTPLSADPDPRQLDRLRQDLQVQDRNLSVNVESGPPQFAGPWSWAAVGLTTLIAVAASGIALALARADARRDSEVLVSIGASPRVQRSYGFWQGAVTAGVGAVIGVVLGLVPAFALGLKGPGITHGFLPFAPPLVQLALVAVGMPLLVAAGAWLTVRTRRSAVRTRQSPLA